MNETGDIKVAFNDCIMKAGAIGLEKYPLMTGQLAGDAIQLADAIHVGLAISVPDGLVAPLVKDVNKKDVRQLARDSQALIERTRNDKLDLSDLEGGCITVSNLGAFGIESFIPIVVPGQCSILGVGRITDTCVPDNGNILVRRLMNMTLSVDHKVTNGAYAAQFLDLVKKTLENPKELMIDKG
jgi:pyruvate dehydrogenase E2 component (dihydrolipoamide acetyltransferase)